MNRTDGENALTPYDSVDVDVVGEIGFDLAGGAIYSVEKNLDALGEIRYRNLVDETIGFDQMAFVGGLNYKM